MVVWDKVTRLKRLVSITKKPNTAWRQDLGLLRPGKAFPEIRKGWPQFEKAYDPANKNSPSSFRVYRGPEKPKVPVSRLSSDYSEDNFHELLGKFQFEVKGTFPGKGERAEKEVFDTAFALHLVGWMKVRGYFMLGHVQGDTYALSYFRRWLEEKHLSKESGEIEWVRLWDMNTGLQLPLAYKHLVCDKDRRKYKNKKVHILNSLDAVQIRRFEREAIEKLREQSGTPVV